MRKYLAQIVSGVILLQMFFGVGIANAQDIGSEAKMESNSDQTWHIEVLIDSSQKMKQIVEERKKDEILTAHFKELFLPFTALKNEPEFAFRTFGHRSGTREKAKSCEDSELLSDFGAQSWEQSAQQVEKLATKGFSPLAYSLKFVAEDAKKIGNNPLVVILISTSKDSCGGDTKAAANTLKTQFPQAKVYAINFFGDAETQQQLTEIAANTEGKMFDITKVTEVAKTFNEVGTLISSTINEDEESEITSDSDDYATGKNTPGDEVKPDDIGTETGETPGTDTSDTEGTTDTLDPETETESNDTPPTTIETPSTTEPTVSDAANETESGFLSSSLFLYALIGLGVLIVILSVVAVITRRKKAQFAENAMVAAAQPIQEAVPQPVVNENTQLNGTIPGMIGTADEGTPVETSEVPPMVELPNLTQPPEPQSPVPEVTGEPVEPLPTVQPAATQPPVQEAPLVENGNVDLSGMIGTADEAAPIEVAPPVGNTETDTPPAMTFENMIEPTEEPELPAQPQSLEPPLSDNIGDTFGIKINPPQE